MIKVRISFAVANSSKTIAYMSYPCPGCNKNIVSCRTLHRCYNCCQYVVSGGLLVNSAQYRFDYHIGRVRDDGNIYNI